MTQPNEVAFSPPAEIDSRSREPMSQQDVLGFLEARLGSGDPFMNPQREAVLLALRDAVLKRGVDFHHQAVGDFANALARYGALSNVTYALTSPDFSHVN